MICVPSFIISNGPWVAIDAAHIGDSRDSALLNDPGIFPDDILSGVQILESNNGLYSMDILPVLDLGLVAIDHDDDFADLTGANANDDGLGFPRRLRPSGEQMLLQLVLGRLEQCNCIVDDLLIAGISTDSSRDKLDLRRRKGIERMRHVVLITGNSQLYSKSVAEPEDGDVICLGAVGSRYHWDPEHFSESGLLFT